MALAHVTPSHKILDGNRVKTLFANFCAALGSGFNTFALAQARTAQYERLNNMSDAQLADMGLKREDIARHVFRDIIA